MEKVILLKTQLVEAARLGKSDDFRFQRLAVILLDNFVEIQLSSLIQKKFHWNNFFTFQEKKYKEREKRKILMNYDELLKTCVKENFINKEELFLLSFCHDIRNNLYHKIDEEKLLVSVALRILQELITTKQPTWKNAKEFTAFSSSTVDPYSNSNSQHWNMDGNSEDEWKYFLKEYFDFIDKRKSSSSTLLKKNLIEKIKASRSNYKFIKDGFHTFFPYAENWEFNDYLLQYSFDNINREKIEEIRELNDTKKEKEEYYSLFKKYKDKWQHKTYKRLKKIEEKVDQMSTLSTHESLEKYISLRTEVNMINDALMSAAVELDNAIQDAVDRARGK